MGSTFKQDPRIKNTNPAIDNYSAVDLAHKDLKADPRCKGVFQSPLEAYFQRVIIGQQTFNQ